MAAEVSGMRILVVGSGGREHALAWRLARDPSVTEVLAAPGNPGIASEARCLPVPADDLPDLVALVEREDVDLTVVGPEVPLVLGLVDALQARGHAAFGPSAAAARLEGSKAFAKDVMRRAGVPTAVSATFTREDWADDRDRVLGFLRHDLGDGPAVVKADGLAAGKGVVVADSAEEATRAVQACLGGGAFGRAGASVVIEERLEGPEVSAFALADGNDVVPLAFAQDFKRVGDADTGPNTGGMGAFSPVPFVSEALAEAMATEVLEPTVRQMAEDEVPYRGVLYAGVMLTRDGPKVLVFYCRSAAPETQALMPRLRSEPAELFAAAAGGTLGSIAVDLRRESCVTVVLASGGYPGEYGTGFEISGLEEAKEVEGALVFHAGTTERQGRVVTAGGRVLSVSALGGSLTEARTVAYEAASHITFEGMQRRSDIAAAVAGEERR
jgi:phosphoribosylamine--glycine ligase